MIDISDSEIRNQLIKAGWTPPQKNNAEVQQIVDTFMRVNGTASVRPTDKAAARTLVKAYGVEPVVQIITVMRGEQGKPYCPSINNIKNILDKWVMIERYLTKRNTKQEMKW